jgi:hypothetical protein
MKTVPNTYTYTCVREERGATGLELEEVSRSFIRMSILHTHIEYTCMKAVVGSAAAVFGVAYLNSVRFCYCVWGNTGHKRLI